MGKILVYLQNIYTFLFYMGINQYKRKALLPDFNNRRLNWYCSC